MPVVGLVLTLSLGFTGAVEHTGAVEQEEYTPLNNMCSELSVTASERSTSINLQPVL